MARALCVRCGLRPRAVDTFLCVECRADQATFREMAEARRVVRERDPLDDGRSQRYYLTRFHGWSGGWPAIR